MSDNDVTKIAEAASAVMNALGPLTPEERARVIQSAAALFGVSVISAQIPSGAKTETARGEPPPTGNLGGATASGKPTSLVELLKEKQPVTNPQRIACFAYYREKYEKLDNFAAADLKGYFAKAKLPDPGRNYTRDYNRAVKDAWIHDEGAQSYLTQDGENAVLSGFGGKMKPRGSTAGKRRKKSGKSE